MFKSGIFRRRADSQTQTDRHLFGHHEAEDKGSPLSTTEVKRRTAWIRRRDAIKMSISSSYLATLD
jgi:hypothetical protein